MELLPGTHLFPPYVLIVFASPALLIIANPMQPDYNHNHNSCQISCDSVTWLITQRLLSRLLEQLENRVVFVPNSKMALTIKKLWQETFQSTQCKLSDGRKTNVLKGKKHTSDCHQTTTLGNVL